MEWVTNTKVLDELRATHPGEVWDVFVEHFRPMIVNFGRKLGLPPAHVEDAAQETLIEFVKQLRAGKYDREKGRLRSWLFGIARNEIKNYARKLPRDRVLSNDDGQDSFFEMLEDEKAMKHTWNTEWRRMVVLGCLKRVFREFSAETFNAFRLYALGGKPADEAAKELGMTANAVRIAKHRILVRMREFVEKFEQAF